MEVILRAAVDNLGHPGDIVNVAPGYGRNYLVPRGLAYAGQQETNPAGTPTSRGGGNHAAHGG